MTIIQLEYLLAVANCGSFSLAAEHCFVTQPSLSMQVKASCCSTVRRNP